jgi:hypothetical protein
MNDNEERVQRIKEMLGCQTDTELAERIKSHPPNITRWKRRGFYPIVANLIDEMIKVNLDLRQQITALSKE